MRSECAAVKRALIRPSDLLRMRSRRRVLFPCFGECSPATRRSLEIARGHHEPAGQIAAREMEIVRIKGALQRAEELSDDVAAAIERAL
jgi:hypothetical protein